MFTQPAFIRKNTPELRKKLEGLGYKPSNVDDHKGLYLWTAENGLYYSSCNHLSQKYGEYIAPYGIFCEDNEELFLAIAALRDDTDKWQLFCDNEFNWKKRFFICRYDTIKEHINRVTDGDCGSYKDFHKATVEELIEHFKTK